MFTGSLCLKLRDYKSATDIYRELLERNPENSIYYTYLQDALQLKTAEERLQLLTHYREKFPKALAPARLFLNHTYGNCLYYTNKTMFVVLSK